jgi:hypothetical protein
MHPNKYKQNENIRPESLLKTIASVTSMLLMVLGIVGIALDFFNGNGLFGQAFSYLFQSIQSMLLIPLILFALWLLNRWISTPSKNETKKSGNLPMYIMVLVGAYYAFRLILTGGL